MSVLISIGYIIIPEMSNSFLFAPTQHNKLVTDLHGSGSSLGINSSTFSSYLLMFVMWKEELISPSLIA